MKIIQKYIYQKITTVKYYDVRFIKRYITLINNYSLIQNDIINNYEIHHILPKSLFPDDKTNSDNLIKLPHKAHYIAHYFLSKIYKDKMIYAFNLMCNKNIKNNRIKKYNKFVYNSNKELFSKNHSEWHKLEPNNDGISNSILIGQKTKKTKNLISENYYTEISQKSAETMKNTIQENGLTIAQNRSLKSAETIKQNNSLKGAKSANAKVIQVYNNLDELQYEFFGDFFSKSKELGLPTRAFKSSYNNNSKPIYTTKCGMSVAHNNGYSEYIGWYAVCVCRTRDYQ